MEELLEKYHEKHEVTYELRAIIDGEVVAVYTDSQSLESVAGYAYLGDEKILRLAMQEHISKKDNDEQVAEEQLMEAIGGAV